MELFQITKDLIVFLDNATVESLYNDGVPSTTAIAPTNSQAWYKLDNNEKFDGTNLSIENQKYPANWESSFNSGLATGMLRDNDSKSEYDNQLFSMSVWVKPKSGIATNGDIFACKGSSNQGVSLRYIGNDLMFQLGDATTTAVDGGGLANNGNWSFYVNRVEDASPDYTEYNKWSHIVVVWNGTDSKFYINGDLVSTITPPSALTIDYSFNNTISAIGGRNDHGSGYFTGNISNFAYWESELDQPAITALYNNGTPEVTISQSPNHWFTLKDFATGSVDQIGSLNYEDSTPSALEFPDNFVSTEAVQSSGLTERSLVNNNVSALNGESSGMNSTNLVQSNLTRKVPFSNYSFNFDSGSSEVIDITNNSIFNLGTSFTISGWFNFSSNKYQGLISFDSSSTRGWFLFQFSDNSILLFDGTTSYTLKTSYTTTNQWDNFIVTYDGSNLIFYINGAQESTQSVSINLQANGNDGQIGNNQFASGRFFNGKMSNIALLDRALTEQEVLKNI